ncbi:hypothetical protein [Lysinibacillus irui]|nr:hypothetical protein [Lysinibacillus irui]MEA0562154.1 hypothetical protein [Lysinibacillus irui]
MIQTAGVALQIRLKALHKVRNPLQLGSKVIQTAVVALQNE